jgi:hypothetical protein
MVVSFVEYVRLNNNNFCELYCPFPVKAIPFICRKMDICTAACASLISIVDEEVKARCYRTYSQLFRASHHSLFPGESLCYSTKWKTSADSYSPT